MLSTNKTIHWLCALSMIVALCGCSADKVDEPVTSSPATASTATSTTVATVTDTAVISTAATTTQVTTTATTASVTDEPVPVPTSAQSTVTLDDNTDVFLLIGSDARAGDTASRSDTLMLIAADHDAHTVKVVSLLRDTWVTIPGLDNNGDGVDDTNKLNTAYFFGGFPLLTQTLSHNFGIDVDTCLAVDFEAFEKAIDTLDGIDLPLTAAEIDWINDHCDPDINGGEGTYHLNGKQVLAFSRARTLYADGDFSRQSNQRQVLRALIAKAAQADAFTMLNTARAMLPFIESDTSDLALLSTATKLLSATGYTIETHYTVPAVYEFEDRWIGSGLGLWLTDMNTTAANLQAYIYG